MCISITAQGASGVQHKAAFEAELLLYEHCHACVCLRHPCTHSCQLCIITVRLGITFWHYCAEITGQSIAKQMQTPALGTSAHVARTHAQLWPAGRHVLHGISVCAQVSLSKIWNCRSMQMKSTSSQCTTMHVIRLHAILKSGEEKA